MGAELMPPTIRVTPELQLTRVLDDAVKSPVVLERDGVRFRLSRVGDSMNAASEDRRQSPAPRGEDESLIDYFDRVQRFIMRGRVFVDDSTELLRESRIERTAELLRASGSLTRDDPIWWDVARSTLEHFSRVRDAIFGNRVVTDDSAEIIRQTREERSNELMAR
jgi:hypothetical protein